MIELLAPSGNIASGYANFKAGADAIYLGGRSFSARASATNYSNEEIIEITKYAHSIGKKVYVALNTLLFQDEFFKAVEFATFLYSINIDGIIIQDLGLANYLHKTLPGLPLNASTQLNCHNLEQARALIDLGFTRIVLAREANIDLVKQVKALGVEVEVFVQGALCVSYSGNCLMSSFIGDRSGNRGRCAQPCRMPYSLYEDNELIEDKKYLLSTKDLMELDNLLPLIEAGVDSLKIEGRLKGLEYGYMTSKAYRHALDAVSSNSVNTHLDEDKDNLQRIFSRSFTKGYLFDESPFRLLINETPNHQGQPIGRVVSINKSRVSIKLDKPLHRLDGIRFNNDSNIGLTVEKMFLKGNPVETVKEGDIIEVINIDDAYKVKEAEVIKTKDYVLNKTIEEDVRHTLKVGIKGTFFAKENAPIMLTATFNGKKVSLKGDIALKAENSGTSIERIKDQLKKSGEYPYYFEEIDMKVFNCYVPISSINKLRNEVYQLLLEELTTFHAPGALEYTSSVNSLNSDLSTRYIAEKKHDAILKEYGLDYFTYKDYKFQLLERVNAHPVITGKEVLTHYLMPVDKEHRFIASCYANITNSYALDCFFEHGYDECILSLELDKESIELMMEDYKSRHGNYPKVGILGYGKIDMMLMKSCPIGTHYKNKGIHCNRCHNHIYALQDRIGVKYHLLGDPECNTRILMDKPIYLYDKLDEIEKLHISNFYYQFTDEDINEVIRVLDNKKDIKRTYKGHYINRCI